MAAGLAFDYEDISQLMEIAPCKKRSHELSVFLEFARAANLAGDPTSAEIRDPPEPDIYYPSPSQPSYFELARLADANYAKALLEVQRKAPMQITSDLSNVGYPQRDVLRRKLSKSYRCSGLPVQLLLYFDTDSALEGPLPPWPFEEEAAHVMEPILRESMGPFTKVWYFERYRRTILWSYP